MNKKKNCVVIFNKSWGEVDFMLPLIRYLNKKKINVISVFRNEKIFDQKKNYLDLYKLLIENSLIINKQEVFNYNSFKILYFFSIFKNLKILINKLKNFQLKKINYYFKNIQKDNSELAIKKLKDKYEVSHIMCADFDSNYQIWIDNFKKSKFLLFPHAITLRGTEYNEFRNISKDYKDLDNNIRIESLKKFPVGTVFYSCNDDELYFFKKFVGSNIILKNIGFVRLSKEWINFRKKKFKNIKQNIFKKKNLLLLVGKVSYIGQNELDKKINDIIRIAEKINHNIIIKNHPRNNFNIKRYSLLGKNVKIFESNESLHAILPKVEFVIMTSKSGVCMDCIAYGKIPIEFYKYNRNNLKNNFYEFRFNSNITSIYKFKNLTFSFDNFIKLSTFVDLITKNNFLKNQYFRKIKKSYKKIVEQNQDCLKNFTEIFN